MRALHHDIKPGVLADMGKSDDWPKLRGKIMTHNPDIFILGLPI
ncbi:hypothetical protein [Mesorhizobium sp.]|nr:hypothetical protein [Mesorhizobium sp.]